VTKPRKPFTTSATQKQNLVEENPVDEDLVDEDLVDEINTDETFSCLELKYVVEYKPPSGKKVRFSPEIVRKEKLARPVTRSLARKQIQVEETKSETHVHCATEDVVEV
jgi:hypothetical protein